jgi:hypothetical protein
MGPFGRGAVLAGVALSLSLGLVSGAFAAPRRQSDPFVQQATLTASDEVGQSRLGSAVALSHDGRTVLIGGPGDNAGTGAAWVFTRKGSTWAEQGKLTGSGEVGSGQFGTSVALSSDGKVALIGAPTDNGVYGAAWVFTRTGSTWKQQGAKLTGSGEQAPGEESGNNCIEREFGYGGSSALFGKSVALSSKGDTALVGAPRDGSFRGAAWVFGRRGSNWLQQGEKLTGGGEDAVDHLFGFQCWGLFGASVSLAADGHTALIGGPGDSIEGGAEVRGPRGAAWVFTRSDRTWAQDGEKLGGNDGQGAIEGIWFGTAVALSGDGSTALMGGPQDDWSNGLQGAAWVFSRSGSAWIQEGEKLRDGEQVAGFQDEEFGDRVALSGDADTALIGNRENFPPDGSASIFTHSGSTWTQQTPRLRCSGACEGLALSGDASTALVGPAVFVRSVPRK